MHTQTASKPASTLTSQIDHNNLQALRHCVKLMKQHQSRFQLVIENPKNGDRYLIMERDDRLQDHCISIRANGQDCQIMSGCFPLDRDHMGFRINARLDRFTAEASTLSPSVYEVVDFLDSALAGLPCIQCERIDHLTKTRYIWEPAQDNAWQR